MAGFGELEQPLGRLGLRQDEASEGQEWDRDQRRQVRQSQHLHDDGGCTDFGALEQPQGQGAHEREHGSAQDGQYEEQRAKQERRHFRSSRAAASAFKK